MLIFIIFDRRKVRFVPKNLMAHLPMLSKYYNIKKLSSIACRRKSRNYKMRLYAVQSNTLFAIIISDFKEGGLFLEIKVGELIKAKREERNIPLAVFAGRIGISPGYLSKLENGHKVNPKLEIVLMIIKELEIDLDMLLGLDAQPAVPSARIPSLIRLILAKERNSKVLENKDVQKKLSSIIDRALESKYLIEDEQLYSTYLEDIYIQMETTLKRYISIQILMH